MNSSEDADTFRLKGLKLVDNLKQSLNLVKQPPDFGSKSVAGYSKKSLNPQPRKSNTGLKSFSNDDASTNFGGSMLSHDPSMSSLQLLYTNLEKYIEHKPKYDKFYLAYLDMCSNMNFDGIIEIYLQSNIRMQSLQKGFNSRECEKAEK